MMDRKDELKDYESADYEPADYEPADIAIYIQGKGIVLKEKSLVACDPVSGKILAFGTEAERMAEQASGHIRVVSPLRRGMIADYFISVHLFTCFLQKAWGRKRFLKPRIALCVPEGITPVERKALEDVLLQSHARAVTIATIPFEQLTAMAETPEKLPRQLQKCGTIIGIIKEDPEKYAAEDLRQLLRYAGKNGISPERIADLLKNISANVKSGTP